MDNIIKDFKNNENKYTKKIKDSKYIEGKERNINNISKIKDICEIILGNQLIEYNNIEEKQRNVYIENKKLELISSLDLKTKYFKTFNESLLNNSFQKINHLSSILYLNEYYDIHCVIFNSETNKYYRTTYKNKPIVICEYKNNSWFLNKENKEISLLNDEINDLSNIITIDHPIIIWKSGFFPLSKYKLPELKQMCIDKNLPLLNECGKKKNKKELYSDLNLNYYKCL